MWDPDGTKIKYCDYFGDMYLDAIAITTNTTNSFKTTLYSSYLPEVYKHCADYEGFNIEKKVITETQKVEARKQF